MKTSRVSGFKRKNLEIEVKLKVRNLRKVHREILGLGFQKRINREFEDNWIFDFPGQSLAQSQRLLRLRQFMGRALLTFKGPSYSSAHFKVREELETEVQDPKIVWEILQRLGLSVTFRYQKYRSEYEEISLSSRGKTVLTVDETPIGNYVEIEASPKEIQRIAARLGYATEDFIKESYLDLFAKAKSFGRSREVVF